MVDIIIIMLLLLGAAIGAKKGFTRQLVDTVGSVAIIVIAFLFKGTVSEMLYKVMPFFNFSGDFQGLTSLNILLYEVIAFIVIFSVLAIILAVLRYATGVFEKLLKATIIMGIPSSILGAIVGLINNVIYLFVILYFLNLPVFGLDMIKESKVSDAILTNTPVLSNICAKTLKVFEDVDGLIDKYKKDTDPAQLNQETLQLLVDENIVKASTVNELISRGKLTGVKPVKE